ncbi:MAG: hypothetical protein ACYTGH_21450 [Planctomycetota bacterium]|jgi:hypothetical protein
MTTEATFAFNHILLHTPEEWAPTRCIGSAEEGSLVLDDGNLPQLDVQWKRLGGGDLERIETEIIRKHRTAEVEEVVVKDDRHRLYRMSTPQGPSAVAVVIQADQERYVLVERYHPPRRGAVEELARIIAPLLAPLDSGAVPWRFFSTSFRLPAAYRLTEAELSVGCFRLDFKNGNQKLTLWDLSMLEQIEKRDQPARYAQELVKSNFIKR